MLIERYNLDWEKQTDIDPERVIALTAALFHYDLDHGMLMRYLGKNFTGEHRDVPAIVSILTANKIEQSLINKYVRVMTVVSNPVRPLTMTVSIPYRS